MYGRKIRSVSEGTQQSLKDPPKGRPESGGTGRINVAVTAESTSLEEMAIGKATRHVRNFEVLVLEIHQSDDMNLTMAQ